MKNVNDLRNSLLSLYEEIKCGEIDVKIASEMNNTAGKIINSVKLELEYSAQKKSAPNIKFLDYE
jgi:hypothetical protein